MTQSNFRFTEFPKKLIGHIKRCFLNEADCYTVCSDFFRYRGDVFNYLSLELLNNGRMNLRLGIWFENLGTYLPKLIEKSQSPAHILKFADEISQQFLTENEL